MTPEYRNINLKLQALNHTGKTVNIFKTSLYIGIFRKTFYKRKQA